MIGKKLEGIDKEIKLLKNRSEFGGPDALVSCGTLENVMRDLKVFDQRKHKKQQLTDDMNARIEGIILSLEKIVKVMKENGMV